jgi:polyhydroxyalkanoate synthesis regulator phasin
VLGMDAQGGVALDPELRAYLDEMRRESSERSDALEQRVLAGIHAVDEALRAEIRAGDAALRTEIQAGDEALRAEIRAGDEALRAEIRAGYEATRRGVAEHVDARLDGHTHAMREALASMEAHLEESIHARKEDVDAAFKDIDVLRTRVRRLERRLAAVEEGRK